MKRDHLDTTATLPRFASALSEAENTAQAVDELIAKLANQIDQPVDLLTIFATVDHREKMDRIRDGLQNHLDARAVIGTTAEGVIGVGREVERKTGVTVLAGHLPGSLIQPIRYDPGGGSKLICASARGDSFAVPEQDVPRIVILLADPFTTPVGGLLAAIKEVYGDVPVVGGMASGAEKQDDNRLLANDRVMTGGAVGVMVGGDIRADTTVSQGCRPIGKPYVITRAKRNMVTALGGEPALEVVRSIVEDLSADDRELVQTHGLHVGRVINEYKSHFGRGDFLIRGIGGVDEQTQAIGIADPAIRTGQTIQFHVHDRHTAREDLALLMEIQKLHDQAGGGLLFSCNGRGGRLFGESDVDAKIVESALGPTPLAGFFAAGEFGPIDKQNFIHGHTASLVVFRPADNDEAKAK